MMSLTVSKIQKGPKEGLYMPELHDVLLGQDTGAFLVVIYV